jgi:hypothetical protein
MGITHYGSLGDIGMQDQRAFYLSGAHAVTRHVQHIIDTTGDTQIAILISQCAISGKVVTGIDAEIRVDHPLMIAINGPDLAGPGLLDD